MTNIPPRIGLFARMLDEKRRELGLSHAAFAAALDIDAGYWSRIRRGKRRVSIGMAERVVAKWPEFSGYHGADLHKPGAAQAAQAA